MRDSEAAASDLEAAFSGSAESEHADAGHANLAFLRLTKQCADCHMEYRNVPLRDKERRAK